MLLDELIMMAWMTPFFYSGMSILGGLAQMLKYRRCNNAEDRDLEVIIFQIPTIGNYRTVNQIFEIVRGYHFPVPLQCWAVVEEADPEIGNYNADRTVVVPAHFTCNALYKARALEWARRLRRQLVEEGALPSKYLLMQADDDSYPSKEFAEECLRVEAALIVGTITPRTQGFWSTILDYERSVACITTCNFWTNMDTPIWAHGEALCISAEVDREVEYSFEGVTEDDVFGDKLPTSKIISSEDMIYTHKVANTGKYRLYNSTKPVLIAPPLTIRDAVKQRRRWTWGHWRLIRHGLLPLSSILRLLLQWGLGLGVYVVALVGIPLYLLNLFSYPPELRLATYSTLLLWLGLRGYCVGKVKGPKHAVAAALASYLTVTLNFFVHVAGILQGDPKRFDVIRKVV